MSRIKSLNLYCFKLIFQFRLNKGEEFLILFKTTLVISLSCLKNTLVSHMPLFSPEKIFYGLQT